MIQPGVDPAAAVKVEDKGDLEYQAGQEESEPAQAQDQQKQQEKDQAAPEEGGGEPEEQLSGQEAVNDDTEDKYEDRQFAAPQVSPPDVGQHRTLGHSIPIPSTGNAMTVLGLELLKGCCTLRVSWWGMMR